MISGISEPKIDGLLGKCARLAGLARIEEPSLELLEAVDGLAATLRRTAGTIPADAWWIPSALVALETAADDLRRRLP